MLLFTDLAAGIADPWLRRAYLLAENGRGTVSPNPLVGCVIVRDGTIVGEGYHLRAGGPHAEAAALAAAGERARGAHVFVTLEPCNHFGKTPPCVQRLLDAGVASVVIGMRDPNPHVTGSGAQALAKEGVRIAWAENSAPFEIQNEAWLARMRTGRSFVTVKVALTLDGRPALCAGRRSQITGPGGSSVTMRLRAASTAVAVGTSTVAIDNPLLTVRTANSDPYAGHTPRRVVLSRTTVPHLPAAVFANSATSATPAMLLVSDAAPSDALDELSGHGVEVVRYPYESGLFGAFSALAQAGIDDVLVEAGPTLFSALWSSRLIDKLVVVSAGGMGGDSAPALFSGTADTHDGDLGPPYRAVEAAVVDGDVAVVWSPRDDKEGKGSAN